MDWRHRAACRDEDPSLFFPVGPGVALAGQVAEAKKICKRRPVTEQCLNSAFGNGDDAGIFGGLDADERRALKRRNRAKART